MHRLFLTILMAFLVLPPVPVRAADPSKIDRTIAREPAYVSKAPRYCLLAYGPEAKARVWLVLDGEVLHVDRNGNGNLTEDGKRFAGKQTTFQVSGDDLLGKGPSFDIGEVPAFGKELTHDLRLTLNRKGKGDWVIGRISDGYWTESPGFGNDKKPMRLYHYHQVSEGFIAFADRPQDAPVVHFGGPLTLALMDWGGDTRNQKLSREKETRLSVMVGTPVAGPNQTAFVRLGRIQTEVVLADITFPNQDPAGKPIFAKTSLGP
jgi:hypothetical protein